MSKIKKIYRIFAGTFSVLVLLLLACTVYLQQSLPDKFYLTEGETFSIESVMPINAYPSVDQRLAQVYRTAGNSYSLDLKVFGGISLKQVHVEVVPKNMVIPCGTPFGIKMFTQGVMVVGMSDLKLDGKTVNPAKNAGLKLGDIITKINGTEVNTNEEVSRLIENSRGLPLKFSVERDGTEKDLEITPLKDSGNGYKAGIWVRDSSAGIGTMTYIDPHNKMFAGLGHAVCDVDTGDILPLLSGEIVDVSILGCTRGSAGSPGELKGVFLDTHTAGTLAANTEAGVFGTIGHYEALNDPVPIAMRQEVKTGKAEILTTVNGNKPQKFEISIEKINFSDQNPTKNMVIRITDPALIEKTGGIVQGMSGSPILQNGKLVGAVTHVLVNDPTKGYAIFAENMEKTAQGIKENSKINQAS